MSHCETELRAEMYISGTSNIAILNSDPRKLDLLSVCKALYARSEEMQIPTHKFAFVYPNHLGGKESIFCMVFIQYIPPTNEIDLKGNCGNALVAAYMYVRENFGVTGTASIYTSNTGKLSYLTHAGNDSNGNDEISMEFPWPAGSVTKTLLPLTRSKSQFFIPSIGPVCVSVVDAGNPYVWLEHKEVSPVDMDSWGDNEFQRMLVIRNHVQGLLHIDDKSVFPKIAAIAPSKSTNHDIQARMITVPAWHPTFALTGLICMCAALSVRNSVVREIVPNIDGYCSDTIQVLTPGGIMKVTFSLDRDGLLSNVSIVQKVKKIGGIVIDYVKHQLV